MRRLTEIRKEIDMHIN